MESINRDVVNKLVEILEPFKTAILALETCKHPTLPFVWLRYLRLKDYLDQDYQGPRPTMMSNFKRELKMALEEKLIISMEHQAGVFLHPSFRLMDFDNWVPVARFETEKARVHRFIRQLIENTTTASANHQPMDSVEDAMPIAGQKRHASSDDDFLDEFGPKRPRAPDDEVDTYLKEDVERIHPSDVLNWWKNKSDKFPRLSRLARKLLAIPATSAASESVFSRAGRTVTDLRSSLSPENVRHLLFLHCNRH